MPAHAPSLIAAGALQRVERSEQNRAILVVDEIHGTHLIEEPILVHLIQSSALLRLEKVHQHGVTALLGITPPVTRYEHSIGAMLIVRSVGGSLEEQVFGLLHDVAHTVLSHVVDWALSPPGTSYHEENMFRYINSTDLPNILQSHGFKYPECLNEHDFPLVELPSPHLCADRLDYALRDAASFGKLALADSRKIVKDLTVAPNLESPRRLLTLRNPEMALILAQSYLNMDQDVWSNPVHIDIYSKTGKIIRDLSQITGFDDTWLWNMSDTQFWELLHSKADEENQKTMQELEAKKLEDYDVKDLPAITKIRTIDPDICEHIGAEPRPLSSLNTAYAQERQRYILSRAAIMRA